MISKPLYIWRVLELMSRQVIMSVCDCLHLMLTYVVGAINAAPIYKIAQRVLILVIVRSYILTVRGHSLVRVSIWYSSLWNVVLVMLLMFQWNIWCSTDGKNFKKLWKFKNNRNSKPDFVLSICFYKIVLIKQECSEAFDCNDLI